jgi:hypothetical protein
MSLSAEDSVALLQLVARADDCASARDVDGYVALFTSDGVINGGMGTAQGHAELSRTVAEVWGREPPGSAHLTLNAVIRGTGERPEITSTLLLVSPGPPPELFAIARVTQSFRWQADGWRISVRHIDTSTQHHT